MIYIHCISTVFQLCFNCSSATFPLEKFELANFARLWGRAALWFVLDNVFLGKQTTIFPQIINYISVNWQILSLQILRGCEGGLLQLCPPTFILCNQYQAGHLFLILNQLLSNHHKSSPSSINHHHHQWYYNRLGPLAGGSSGLSTSSFEPFRRSGRLKVRPAIFGICGNFLDFLDFSGFFGFIGFLGFSGFLEFFFDFGDCRVVWEV